MARPPGSWQLGSQPPCCRRRARCLYGTAAGLAATRARDAAALVPSGCSDAGASMGHADARTAASARTSGAASARMSSSAEEEKEQRKKLRKMWVIHVAPRFSKWRCRSTRGRG